MTNYTFKKSEMPVIQVLTWKEDTPDLTKKRIIEARMNCEPEYIRNIRALQDSVKPVAILK